MRLVGRQAFFTVVGCLTATLALVPPAVVATLAYDRSRVLGGEAWRLLSAHVVHAGPAHAVWNLAGLALVWIAFGPRLTGLGWLSTSLACALGSTLGVLAFHPEVRFMAGLSGALHGLLVAGAIVEIRERGRIGWLVVGIVALKVGWEQLHGPAAAAPVAIHSHLYGALTGLLAGLVLPAADGARGTRPGPAPSPEDSARAAGGPHR